MALGYSGFRFFACLLCAMVSQHTSAAPASQTAKSPSTRSAQDIQDLEAYYAKLYGEPLNSPDRLPREIAVISLSRIDAPDTTQRLLDALNVKSKERDPVVAYLA